MPRMWWHVMLVCLPPWKLLEVTLQAWLCENKPWFRLNWIIPVNSSSCDMCLLMIASVWGASSKRHVIWCHQNTHKYCITQNTANKQLLQKNSVPGMYSLWITKCKTDHSYNYIYIYIYIYVTNIPRVYSHEHGKHLHCIQTAAKCYLTHWYSQAEWFWKQDLAHPSLHLGSKVMHYNCMIYINRNFSSL